MFSVDQRYCYTSFNRQYVQLIQVLYGSQIELGHYIFDYISDQEHRERTKQNLDRTLSGELVVDAGSWEIGTSKTYFEARYFPVRDQDEIVGVSVIAEDITNQSIEDHLQQTINTIPAMLWLAKPDGSIYYMNDNCLSFTGLSLDQALGIGWFQTLHPDDILATQTAWDEASRNKTTYRLEQRLRRFDGEYHWFLTQATPILDEQGNIVKWHGINTDIHEHKQTEQNLRESEEQFNRTFQASPIGIRLYRFRDRCTVDVNDAYLNLIGYTREEVLGRTPDELNLFVHPEEQNAWLETLYKEGISRDTETIIRRKSGEFRYVIFSSAVIEVRGERLAVVQVVDITEQKQTEARLVLAQTGLEKLVDERTEELRISNLALAKALQAKNEFMAAMSHELRTPLSAVLGLSDALQLNLSENLSEKQLMFIRKIEENGKRLLYLINDILTFTQIQSGDLNFDIQFSSLYDICVTSIELAQAKAATKHQQLAFSIEPEMIGVYVDPGWIKHAIDNLLDNAIKFTPDGGSINVTMVGDRDDQKVRISIADTGIGIQAEDVPRLFQPFVQLDARLSRLYPGTGLGLALAKALVERQGGSIEVESEFGKGSRFTIVLPWQSQP
jgi:PAS domain S-box-containing protein